MYMLPDGATLDTAARRIDSPILHVWIVPHECSALGRSGCLITRTAHTESVDSGLCRRQ
jgi:hypothetical protein